MNNKAGKAVDEETEEEIDVQTEWMEETEIDLREGGAQDIMDDGISPFDRPGSIGDESRLSKRL